MSKLNDIATELSDLTKLFKIYGVDNSGTPSDIYITGTNIAAQLMTAAFNFGGQAHPGYKVETFSAAKEFNLNNGNNQYMPVSANTVLSLANKLPGTYIIQLQNTALVTSITLDASFGTAIDNCPDFVLTSGSRNKITVHVDAYNQTDYINSPITA